MRFIITHARFADAQVAVDVDPKSRSDRNNLRRVLRAAERGKLAGRDE